MRRAVPGGGSGVHGNGIDHMPGEDRHEEVGHRGYEHGAGDTRDQPRLAPPVAEEERQNITHRVLVISGNTHRSLTLNNW